MKSFFDSILGLSVVEDEKKTLLCQVIKFSHPGITESASVMIKDGNVFVKGSIYYGYTEDILKSSAALALFEPYKKEIENMEDERVKEQLLKALY